MTLTVSISDLRNNISNYLDKVIQGTRVLVRDEKRGITIAEIVQSPTFDKDLYEKTLRKVAGTFSADNHPEWKTEADVTDWVQSNRSSDQRSF